MKLATWNVGTLYTAGRMNELMKEVDKYKIDIVSARNWIARERNSDKHELYDFIQWT